MNKENTYGNSGNEATKLWWTKRTEVVISHDMAARVALSNKAKRFGLWT